MPTGREVDRRTTHLVDVTLGRAEKRDRLSADARRRGQRNPFWRKAEQYRHQAWEALRSKGALP
jgi:hypothetical protein